MTCNVTQYYDVITDEEPLNK